MTKKKEPTAFLMAEDDVKNRSSQPEQLNVPDQGVLAPEIQEQPADTTLVNEAVAQGKVLIADGKTKVEAAMVIYRRLEAFPQDTVVTALIEGASLTSKGALTYWYNCRRKLKRERMGMK